MSSPTRARSIAAALAAVLALGGLAACGSDSDSSTSSATTTVSSSITVTDVWARESAMSSGNGAVYFVITNDGTSDDELVGVSVDAGVAAKAEIHETVEATSDSMDGGMPGSTEGSMSGSTMGGTGMMTMQPVDSVPVPAGGAVEFAPGGYHVMLIDLTTPLEVGTSFPLTLSFTKAGAVTVTAEVRAS
jgi:periplasmic copper chaperone A